MPKVFCSFCELSNDEKPMMITDNKNNICSDCIESCEEIIKKSELDKPCLKPVKKKRELTYL